MSTSGLRAKTCRFCSLVSKHNGEEPIGAVYPTDEYLILEVAPPWPTSLWMQPDPMPPEVVDLVQEIHSQAPAPFRQLAIAPDREYSRPGYARMIHYRRPARLFAQFEKQEFWVPQALLGPLAIALVKNSDRLAEFIPYRQETAHIRDLFVCTHGNVDAACARFGYPIYRELRQQYANESLRVWRVSHFGNHQFAPTLIDFPTGQYWGHLESQILPLLVRRQGSLSGLCSFYEGWAGLTQFEQIAEREIWLQIGWEWLHYRKAGQVLALDAENADWAEVRVEFISPDGRSGAYEARIESKGTVTTALWTADREDDEPLQVVKQYHVTRLTKTSC